MTPEQALQALTTESQERGEREAFEAWALSTGRTRGAKFGKWDNGEYLDTALQFRWAGWQAGRAPLLKDRNFCPRCGKRAGIHTCTPPEGM